MKNIFYMLLLVITSLTTIQAQDGLIGAIRFTASIGNFTPHGTYDYVGTVGNIGSTGFTVNNITVGAYLLDDNSLYYIDSVDVVIPSSIATLWITDLNAAGTPISGRGQITQGGSNFDLLPVTQHGSNFITAEQTAKLLTHNFMVIDSLMGDFGVNLGDGNQLLISNRTLDFDDKTYTWDLRDANLDEDTWTVLTRDGQSYGLHTSDGAGDVSLKFDALISGNYRNLIKSDRFLDIFIGNSTDTVNIVGKTLKLDLSGLLTDDNNTANILSYDPISKQIKLTDISNVGINPTDTIFYTKIDNITTPINVKDTLVFDFDNTISVNDTLFYVESNNTVTATMKGDTLFFGLGDNVTVPDVLSAQVLGTDANGVIIASDFNPNLQDVIDVQAAANGGIVAITADSSILLQGFGEDVNGLGGDYSLLRPNAIVPKGYVDGFGLFTGITDFEANWWNGEEMTGLRRKDATHEIFIGNTTGSDGAEPRIEFTILDTAFNANAFLFSPLEGVNFYVENSFNVSSRTGGGPSASLGVNGNNSAVSLNFNNSDIGVSGGLTAQSTLVQLSMNTAGNDSSLRFDDVTTRLQGNNTEMVNTDLSILTNNNFFITTNSSPTYKGAQYGHDYSNNFTDRSLTDKAYVVNYAAKRISAYVATAVNLTANVNQSIINVTATGRTITLPTAVGNTGKTYTIKLSVAGTVTVATTASQTIDGATTQVLSTQYEKLTVVSTGTNWIII